MQYYFDIEVFPNFFSALFLNDKMEWREFLLFGDRNDLPELRRFLRQNGLILVGHNSLTYDGIILNAILKYPKIKNDHLYRLSHSLISREYDKIPGYRELRYPESPSFVNIDTLAITRLNQTRVGLKYAGILLKHPVIQDLPFDPNQNVASSDVPKLLEYNRNDVLLQKRVAEFLQPELEMRKQVGQLFGVNILSANDTEIAKQILEKEYVARSGISSFELRKMSTPRDKISGEQCIGKNIHLTTPELLALQNRLRKMVLAEWNYFKFSDRVEVGGIGYDIGIGGLHSRDKDKPGIFESDDQYIIRDCDVNSFYPYIIIFNEYAPAHLDKKLFIEIYSQIVEERRAAKKLADIDEVTRIKAQGLKIASNSSYGLFGNEFSWLYDPLVRTAVCISGQLHLLDLIEKLFLAGMLPISANTDGIVCKIPRDKEDIYFQVCQDWGNRTGFELEFTDYEQCIRKDVNNYIAITTSGKVKTKGVFDIPLTLSLPGRKGQVTKFRPLLSDGFNFPITKIALYQYFVHGIAPEDTILFETDIHNFCGSQRVGAQFDVILKRLDGREEKQQKITRYFVSHDGGLLVKRYKYKEGKQDTALVADGLVQVANTLDSRAILRYNINYDWYTQRVYEIINLIKVRQPEIFEIC